MISTISLKDDAVYLLDQNQLPHEVYYERCETHQEIAEAIKDLKVRGAPLIGVAAAFGLALALKNYPASENGIVTYYNEAERLLAATRPTAVNLFWAIQHMRGVFEQNLDLELDALADKMMAEAMTMYNEDVQINIDLGEHGQELLGDHAQVMTICNAGALATCGYGTALGVIRSAHKRNKIARVWACETRPVMQGARLTVWELMQDKIPVTLITDSMAATVMRGKRISAVIAGADRITANGDTANKVGTYGLAVLAKHHGIPFYIASPLSTIDMNLQTGQEIPIEERNQEEVRQLRGQYITVREAEVYNPAFDVTPHELITGIITEKGIIKQPLQAGLSEMFTKGRDE